ncbi:hypothetical protein RCL1_006950 [Eukaryota sp. TZLM3-RCL]
MLNFLKRLFGVSPPSGKAIIIGLDGAGKSSILSFIKQETNNIVVPTVGFSLEEFTYQGFSFNVFDMSGQSRYRDLWEHYIKEANAVIFVVDATDKLRLCVARDELNNILQHPNLKPVPFLLFANKMDLPDALSPSTITTELDLTTSLSNRNWHISSSCAVSGEGLDDGFGWLAKELKQPRAY